MRSLKIVLALAAAGAVSLFTGCSNMEHKLARGISNLTEPIRMGELRRSIEQNSLAEGPDATPMFGMVHGFSRTFQRTAVGAFEVVTFPIPTEPLILPAAPVFPDSQPRQQAGHLGVGSDQFLGFQDSAVVPFIPGSTFNPLVN